MRIVNVVTRAVQGVKSIPSSWPGIAVRKTASLPLAYARPSTSLRCYRRIEIVPIWICRENRTNLPGARPMLDVVFALDRVTDVLELLKINKPLQPIPFGEA